MTLYRLFALVRFHRTFDPKDWSIERAPWVQDAAEKRIALSRERLTASSPSPKVLNPRSATGK